MTALSGLASAHRGYEFQDLLVACRFVDILLGIIVEARCDEKLFAGDRFDDLTSTDIDGRRERVQLKHTENDDRPLTLDTFTTDRRRLKLDRLLYSMLADRDGPGSQATDTIFRVVLRDQSPIDPRLTAVLVPRLSNSGPFLAGMQTTRLGFDSAALWQQNGANTDDLHPFAFLFASDAPLSYNDLEWCCARLVVEVDAPRASLDLTQPGSAEHLLLTRVRTDVGAEVYPNTHRAAVDVAAAMVSAARATRQGLLIPTSEELLRRTQLRSDFAAVSRSHPVDPALEVRRPSVVEQLMSAVSVRAADGGYLLVEGPPGHGKSWVCQQFLDALSNDGWLIAEHYCYLGDVDGERLERVLMERIFGSLIGRLAEADPRLVHDQRPRYAADEELLVACLRRSRDLEPDRRIALLIDGVDHITRVQSRTGSSFDPSRSVSEALASLDLPPGTVAIILSQPGTHLDPLVEAGAAVVTLEGLTEYELRILASHFGLVPRDDEDTNIGASPRIDNSEAISAFLVALVQRSAGNALYATYLCRETLRSIDTHPDPVKVVLRLPPFDGTLKDYYDHLYQSLSADAGWVADVIALVDFPVSRAELREIRPDAAHRVDDAINHLEPVLLERATQGGVRVYHESFARYLRTPFQQNFMALTALLGRITNWLEQKGLFIDSRAFRSLLPLLAEASEDTRIVDLVDGQFVTKAVAGGFSASAINRNLAIAVGAAARLGQWPVVIRYVELSRSAESYQAERFDSTLVAFADVPAALLGADTLVTRLLDEDRLVMPAREGLQICAALDKLGVVVPWQSYIDGYLREQKNDNTSYGEASDRAVALAQLRGQLRLTTSATPAESGTRITAAMKAKSHNDSDAHNTSWTPYTPIDWSRLAQWVEEFDLPTKDVIRAVLDTRGWEGAMHLIDALKDPASACLVIADELAVQPDLDPDRRSPQQWAMAAVNHGLPSGALRRALKHGVDPDYLATINGNISRERLLDLTRQVQQRSVLWEKGIIDAWLDACALAAYKNPIGLTNAEVLIVGDGWYLCWLRFVVSLSRSETATPADRGHLALKALHLLTDDLMPFAGNLRSCDLYSLHGVIAETLTHAMSMFDDLQWLEGLRILNKVSNSITTTLSGEIGGPVPPDLVLHLAVEGASSSRRGAAAQLIQEVIDERSGRRFYTDLAEYRLLAARLALASDDYQVAAAFWQEACIFLTAYGQRKDITIYEVLDPLPVLIKRNPALARLRIAHAQAPCNRVLLHTDRRGTHHAWPQWWSLLAKADPVATVYLVVPQLFRECNDPNPLLNEVLEDVWREWREHVDSVVAGALRLTLDTPLDPEDPRQLESLASVNTSAARRLLVWLLARADERPISYSSSDSAKLIARDNQQVAKLNEIAEAADVPFITLLRDEASSNEGGDQFYDYRTRSVWPIRKPDVADEIVGFPPGMPGLARAIRAWRTRAYDTTSIEWSSDRFANVIGYRLIDLVAAGRSEDARSALRSLAEGYDLHGRTDILRSIAEGLERHGQTQLAAFAYALAWTSARGGGGFLTFGGETEIDSLHRATALDAQVTNTLVAEEIERIIATSSQGTYGISKAIIHALAVGSLLPIEKSSTSVAFEAWDEAFEVISSRVPRVDDSDDPKLPYKPSNSNTDVPISDDLESVFVLAAIAGLAHPGREKKRRTFLAVQLLLEERPNLCARVLPVALATISDPATLTWLLRMLESSSLPTPILEACQPVLRDLLTRDHLTVRAIARRMIKDDPPPLAPSTSPDKALLEESPFALWTWEQLEKDHDSDFSEIEELLSLVAGRRIQRAERLLGRFHDAVRNQAKTALSSETLKRRLQRQLKQFGDQSSKRWPDAFLAEEQMIEEILQSVAASGRTALLMMGKLVVAPIQWEDDLASALLNDPSVPLTVEALRQPRPPLPPPPSRGDEVWMQIRERISNNSPKRDLEATAKEDNFLLATLALMPVTALPIVRSGPYRDWCWLGTYEKRTMTSRSWPRANDLIAARYRLLEVRDKNDQQSLNLPPVATGDLYLWEADIDFAIDKLTFDSTQPLVGIDTKLYMVGDGHFGLGVPDSLLVPTESLIASLQLRPKAPFIYEDDSGAALALVIWRAEYNVSDYYLAWPQTHGCGIVIRPDLVKTLIALAGEERLILRDFIVGENELASLNTEVPTD